MKNKKFVFCGGGTGGHVYPNIAIYEALRGRYPEADFLYIGSPRGAEGKIVKSLGKPIPFKAVWSRGLPQRLRSLQTIRSLLYILIGAIQSFFVLWRFRPDCVIGSGGYVAAPVLLAAAVRKIPIFIHEQNAVPGRLNLFVARFAGRIGVSFPSTAAFFPEEKAVVVGYPLRQAILLKDRAAVRRKLGIPENAKVLMVCSGSMGARTINRAVAEILPHLLACEDLAVVWSTGRGYTREYKAYDDTVKILEAIGIPSEIPGKLLIREYFDGIDEMYSIADLIISRAGAGAVKEITTLGLPSLLVPKIDLPGDHQILNAREVEKMGGGRVLYEEFRRRGKGREIVMPEVPLLQAIRELLYQPDLLPAMRASLKKVETPNSAELILAEISALCERREKPGETERRKFYLHSHRDDTRRDLPHLSTLVGTRSNADIVVENAGQEGMVEIFFPDRGERAVVRARLGFSRINGNDLTIPEELREGDELEVAGELFTLRSHSERVKTLDTPPAPDNRTRPLLGLAAMAGGYIRTALLGALLGTAAVMDALAAMLFLVNSCRRMNADHALGRILAPVFGFFFRRNPERRSWEAALPLFHTIVLRAFLLTILGMLTAPLLASLLFPAQPGLAAGLLRLLFPTVLLGTVVGIGTFLLKEFGRPLVAAALPLVGTAATVLWLLFFAVPLQVVVPAQAALIGTLAPLLFMLPSLVGVLRQPALDFSYQPNWRFVTPLTRKFTRRQLREGAGEAPLRLGGLIDIFLVARLISGAVSLLYFALEIIRLPFTALLQVVQRRAMRQFRESVFHFDKELARRLFIEGFRMNLFLMMPATILIIMLARPLTSLLLERGRFHALAVSNTTLALQYFALGLTGLAIYYYTDRIFTYCRTFFRLHLYNLLMVLCHGGLTYVLIHTPLGFSGAALASSLTLLLFAGLRMAAVRRQLLLHAIRLRQRDLWEPVWKTSLASLLMVLGLIEAKYVFNHIHFATRQIENITMIISLSFIGISVYFLTSLMLRNTGLLYSPERPDRTRPAPPLSVLPPGRFFEKVRQNPYHFKDEYRYKINLYLNSTNWETRNIGIKLAGLFKDESKIPYLIEIVRGRGRDGFLRRNSMLALKELGPWNAEIRNLLQAVLDDSYYEVRVAAVQFLHNHLPAGEYDVFRPQLLAKLRSGFIEEQLAAVRLLARVGTADDLSHLTRLNMNSNSLVREEILETLYNFYRRGLFNAETLKSHLQAVLITSNNLQPEFRIKAIMQRIYRELENA